MRFSLLHLALPLCLSACAITKPCSEGGDVSWNPKIIGDKRCAQSKSKDGKVLNEGKFQQYYKTTGTLALDGNFEAGQKQGVWAYYGENRKLISVKYFSHGIEETPPKDVQKQIDLLIEAKAGVR